MIEYTVKVNKSGDKFWCINDKLHRLDGPAVEYASGTTEWYVNDIRHREDGPAIEWTDGDKEWYFEGELHREDGPAVEFANGDKEWYIDGKEYTEVEFNAMMNPAKELTVAEIEKLLGYSIKIVK